MSARQEICLAGDLAGQWVYVAGAAESPQEAARKAMEASVARQRQAVAAMQIPIEQQRAAVAAARPDPPEAARPRRLLPHRSSRYPGPLWARHAIRCPISS